MTRTSYSFFALVLYVHFVVSDEPTHWYAAVWQSTGFEAPRRREIRLDGDAARVADASRPLYERLYGQRLRVRDSGSSDPSRPPA